MREKFLGFASPEHPLFERYMLDYHGVEQANYVRREIAECARECWDNQEARRQMREEMTRLAKSKAQLPQEEHAAIDQQILALQQERMALFLRYNQLPRGLSAQAVELLDGHRWIALPGGLVAEWKPQQSCSDEGIEWGPFLCVKRALDCTDA